MLLHSECKKTKGNQRFFRTFNKMLQKNTGFVFFAICAQKTQKNRLFFNIVSKMLQKKTQHSKDCTVKIAEWLENYDCIDSLFGVHALGSYIYIYMHTHNFLYLLQAIPTHAKPNSSPICFDLYWRLQMEGDPQRGLS